MKRIILHWTAGAVGVNDVEADSYHEIIQPDGSYKAGDFPISANRSPLVRGQYAAHTLNCNTDSIGIAIDCMANAKERPFSWGTNPMTEKQVASLVRRTAYYCGLFDIPVTPQTVLTHAEVQGNLGIKQNAKWDITILPDMAKPAPPNFVGNILRNRIRTVMEEQKKPIILEPIAGVDNLTWWQRILNALFGR